MHTMNGLYGCSPSFVRMQPDRGRHAAGTPVAPIGKKPLRSAEGTPVVRPVIAKYGLHIQRSQVLPGQSGKVRQPFSGRMRWQEMPLRLRVCKEKGVPNFIAHFKHLWTNARPQPCHPARRIGMRALHPHVPQKLLQRTFTLLPRQAAPTGMRRPNNAVVGMANEDRQTISHLDGACHTVGLRVARIGLQGTILFGRMLVQRDSIDTVHLLQKNGAYDRGLLQNLTIVCNSNRIILNMVAQIHVIVWRARHTARTAAHHGAHPRWRRPHRYQPIMWRGRLRT